MIDLFFCQGDAIHNQRDHWYKGYNLYLHEDGQFWLGSDMRMIGQTEALTIQPSEEHECSFLMIEKTRVNTPSSPCSDDPDYSFTSCIFTFITNHVGCHWDWYSSARAAGRDHMATCQSRE